MSEENLDRQRSRLARHPAANAMLRSWGLSDATTGRFDLGLKAAYRSRAGSGVVEHALSFPVMGADGARLSRFAFLNLDGITTNPAHPVGWGVGTPLSYWSGVASATMPLVIVPDVLSLWLLEQLLERQDRRPVLLLTRSHGSDLPLEWSSDRFWAGWPSVSVMEAGTETEIGDLIVGCAGRDVSRVSLPEGCSSWTEALRLGLSAEDFHLRLDEATEWGSAAGVGMDPADVGDFGFAPVHVGTAFIDGRTYYPYLVEERVQDQRRSRGERPTLVQGYAVRVLRSDGEVLKIESLPAPRGASEAMRVVALSDGTRIFDEPAVSRFASWSFASIQRFSKQRKRGEPVHRPLAMMAADVEAYLRDCVWLPRPDEYALAVAYVLGTYVFQVFDAFPLLLVNGPAGSGKSELAQAMADVSCNGVVVGQASAAALTRVMHETRGLVVLDDLERIGAGVAGAFGEVAQLLKVAYKRASGRKPIVDRSGAVATLDFYGPKVLTNTRGCDVVLASRTVRIGTAPIPSGEVDGMYLAGPDGDRAQAIRDELHCWGMARAADVHAGYRDLAQRRGRREEIEAPLRAIAAVVGDGFSRRLGAALDRPDEGRPPADPVERVRMAVAASGATGQVAIQQLQLELALAQCDDVPVSPETIGRALVSAGFRSSEGAAARIRLHGVLCRVVELDGPAAPAAGVAGREPLAFCRDTTCAACRYVAVCSRTLPGLASGKGRALRIKRPN